MFSRYKGIFIAVLLLITNSIQSSYTYFAIEQCPGTDVPNIRYQTQFNEISVIFYYTQWSEESLEALQHFNDVAEYFGDKAYFATVDCWHLACNCSKTITTTVGSGAPHKWPTLMIHYGRQGQMKIQYNGLFTFRDMIQFVENVLQPLERVDNREDLNKMKKFNDAIIMGFFEKPESKEYKQYLRAALKWLEHDPLRSYRFTVTFANNLGEKENNDTLTKVPNLLLQSYKSKKSFIDYNDFKWNASNILRWLHEDLNDDYSQLHAYTTPIMIAQKAKKQPVLAVFVNEPQQFYKYMEKYIDAKKPYTQAEMDCRTTEKRSHMNSKWKKILENAKIIQNLLIFKDHQKCYYNREFLLENLKYYYELNDYLKELFSKFAHSKQTKLVNLNLETKELLDFFKTTRCLRKTDIASQTSLHISVVKRLEGYLSHEQELYKSNRSLTAVVLDTQRYRDYLENIAITPTTQSMATVFIIDNETENIFVMEDRYAMYNLVEFIKKFYAKVLYNYYKNKEIITRPTTSNTITTSPNYDLELKEFNRHVFLNYLHHSHNKTLIVLIYSPDCALCGNVQHSFMQLSLSLRHIKDLKFIRINVMDNDLPWQFNMPFLPALLVFPENRYTDSRLFPMHLKPDVRSVFGFILSQLSAQQQVRLVLAVCQSGTLPSGGHTQSCWQFAKTILIQHIGKHLQYWQMFEAERSLIFERLRAFKDMSLDIQRNLRL
ncbi:thioredoxin domain-containing protein 11 [Cochliomyia hominivorax]